MALFTKEKKGGKDRDTNHHGSAQGLGDGFISNVVAKAPQKAVSNPMAEGFANLGLNLVAHARNIGRLFGKEVQHVRLHKPKIEAK